MKVMKDIVYVKTRKKEFDFYNQKESFYKMMRGEKVSEEQEKENLIITEIWEKVD